MNNNPFYNEQREYPEYDPQFDSGPEFVQAELVTPSDQAPTSNPIPVKNSRSILETILDPATLQILMWCGSGLLAIGLLIWLWSVGIFENAILAACALGAANLGLLSAGIVFAMKSRFKWAGRSVALLSCLIMPLNLWLYHSNGLITLDQGGHLWFPALIMSLIFAAVARLLKDSNFVYTFVAGVAMTGMLFLADEMVGRFWEFGFPSAFLVAIGLICIHLERVFTQDLKSDFSRERFGVAFLRSGYVVFTVGLALLFIGNIFAFLTSQLFSSPAKYFTLYGTKGLSLLLVAMGVYGFGYANWIHGKKVAIVPAIFCGGWFTILLIDLLSITLTFEIALIAIAGLAIAIQLVSIFEPRPSDTTNESLTVSHSGIATGIAMLALILSGGHFLGFVSNLYTGTETMQWMLIASMAMSTATFALGVFRSWGSFGNTEITNTKSHDSWLVQLNTNVGIVAAVLTLLAAMFLWGCTQASILLIVGMLAPFGTQILASLSQNESVKAHADGWAQLTAGFLMLVGVVAMLTTTGVTSQWILAGFFAINAILFGQCKGGHAAYVSTVGLCLAIVVALSSYGTTTYSPIIASSIVGLLMMVVSRVVTQPKIVSPKDNPQQKDLAAARFMTVGHVCVALSGLGTVFLATARLLSGEVQWVLLGLVVMQLVVAGLSMVVTSDHDIRKFFAAVGVAELVTFLCLMINLSSLTLIDQVELGVTCMGIVLLITGYIGWYRETQPTDSVSAQLGLGSIMAAAPVVMGLLAHRMFDFDSTWTWNLAHEIGVLVIGLGLLLSGVSCRIKSSTIVGGLSIGVYLISLVTLLHVPDALQNVAVYLMVGGGIFFGGAVLLSIYRDWFLKLPKKLQDGTGIFQVLKWR